MKKRRTFKEGFFYFCKNHWTTPFKLFIIYFLFILIGGGLLYLPISLEDGYVRWTPNPEIYNTYISGGEYTFLDAIFLAASAFTNTGLSMLDVNHTFSYFGEFILYVWIQIGGFGMLSLFYLIGRAINKIFKDKLNNNSFMGYIERGGTEISNSGRILSSIFLIIFIIQIFFSFIFSFLICFGDFNDVWVDPTTGLSSAVAVKGTHIEGYHDYGIALWKSIFLSGSSINNAGFDLFGSYSVSIFRNGLGVFVQVLILVLFVFGGIGYITIYDIHRILKTKMVILLSKISYRIKYKNKGIKEEDTKMSLFSKICIVALVLLGLISIFATFVSEYLSTAFNEEKDISLVSKYAKINLYNDSWWNVNFSLIFHSLSTRSAGFATVSCDQLQISTRWLFIILMFIGASPASTGGGVRNTTIIVAIKTLFQRATNSDDAVLFKKRIPKRMAIESFQIIFIAMSLIILFSILSLIVEKEWYLEGTTISSSAIFFEMASAFGTTGLSTGITGNFNWFSLILLIILMFIGQLGITNTLTTFAGKSSKKRVRGYQDISIRIG